MANWALVIGIDRYWSEGAHLHGAVRDALAVREWLLDPAGGDVPPENLVLVLEPREDSDPLDPSLNALGGTKSNIVVAISNLIALSGGQGDRLYFFFAGHGLTARVANRDESALMATDFNFVNTDHSIALRSLWEYFETTQFADQFFFVDACRNVPPWEHEEFEIGRWTLPRTRDPGVPPVQQFILYATSPKLKAAEVREKPGEEHGAFTAALLDGLRGAGAAKAWSWSRECYEVRWERLADYVKKRVEREARAVAETPEGKLLQIPQDTGSRGVAGRERDAVLSSYASGTFAKERLEVKLDPDAAYATADVRVLNGVGDIVAGVTGVTGESVAFYLRPGTYALRASEPKLGQGRVAAPVELYGPLDEPPSISLRPIEEPPEDDVEQPASAAAPRGAEPAQPGTIPLEAPDPLSIVEIRDETGNGVDVARARPQLELPAGLYRVRHVGPEASSEETCLALAAGETEESVSLDGTAPSPATLELLEAMGGRPGPCNTVALEGHEPVAWAEPSTLVALALGTTLAGEAGAAALDLHPPREGSGVAVYVVASGADELDPAGLEVRVWPAGHPVAETAEQVRIVAPRLAEVAVSKRPGPYWLSLRRGGEQPMVFALTVLHDRLATIVAQVDEGTKLYQYHPATGGGPSATPETLRRAEYLQRLMLAGRLDGARELAVELAQLDDPFLGCLCGYTLLRLGLMDELHATVERVLAGAPGLSDAFVLRGEHSAATGGTLAKQAFAEAVAAGIPLFGEGLTRLLEGLRAHDLHHPRGAIVRFVFQNHMHGSMWSVFAPARFEPGTLVVTGADTGYEA